MNAHDGQKVVRRLAAAEGYLEIGLPGYALTELGRITEAGPFEAIAELLRGEALQAQERFDEAIPALNRAAELFPSPFNQRALISLSRCYRMRGELTLAEQAEAAALSPDMPPGSSAQMVIAPIFLVQTKPPKSGRPPLKG